MSDFNYLIVNPSRGNDYFDTAGSAITSSNQPSVTGGAALGLGSDTSLLDNAARAYAMNDVFGSTVVQTVDIREMAISGRNFATMTENRYIMMRGGSNTEYIAGTSDTTLRSGAADFGDRRLIHKVEALRNTQVATALRANQWNQVTGTWDANKPESVNSGVYDIVNSRFTNVGLADHAAIPSGEVPGELAYHFGSGNMPFQDAYKPKYSF